MTPAAGLALLLLGLLAWLAGEHVKALRFFDRPALARRRLFDPLLSLARWTLTLAGLVLVGLASRRALVAVVLALAPLWGYRRYIRSASFQRRLLRRDFESLRREHPEAADREIFCRLVYRRHPRWGVELIEMMVADNPDLDSLARVMARMERGFRGFRPGGG